MKKRDRVSRYYPIFLNIGGRRCVVVGGGAVALRKTKALLEHGASVTVISPDLCPELSRLEQNRAICVLHRGYVNGDLDNAFIVVAATDNSGINGRVVEEARKGKVLVNVVDEPERSDFIVPSYLRRGDIAIAVSTDGKSPALARKLRIKLEEDLGPEYTALASLVGEVRCELKERGITANGDIWHEVLDIEALINMIHDGRTDEAKALLVSSLEKLGQREVMK